VLLLLLLQITPHILIFWRPDVSSFVAYMLKPAAKGTKVSVLLVILLVTWGILGMLNT
jgi:hypothetical protein